MSTLSRISPFDQPATYCIKVQGRLDPSWANWFRAAAIEVTRGPDQLPVTTLVGEVADQAALYGWLSRLRDLGLPLLLVEYMPVPVVPTSQETK
jgi:hypothetical protein